MGYSSFNLIKTFINSNKYKTTIQLNSKNKRFCSFLFQNGFIEGYNIDFSNKIILMYLSKYHYITPIKYIKQVSKPGGRRYISYKQLLQWKNRNTFFVISSSKGIISSKEAISNRLGGEVLFIFKC